MALRRFLTLPELFPRPLFFIIPSTDIASSETADVSSSEILCRSTGPCSLSSLRSLAFILPASSARGMFSSSEESSLSRRYHRAILGKGSPPSHSLLLLSSELS